jgi:hypothetical protein
MSGHRGGGRTGDNLRETRQARAVPAVPDGRRRLLLLSVVFVSAFVVLVVATLIARSGKVSMTSTARAV